MARLNAPFSTAVVEVPDELADRYLSLGWTAVKKSEPAVEKRKPGRPKK